MNTIETLKTKFTNLSLLIPLVQNINISLLEKLHKNINGPLYLYIIGVSCDNEPMKLFNCKLLINLNSMFDNFFKIRRLFIILLTLFSHDLIARSWRVSQIPNGSVNGCRTCHNSSYRSLNSFGLDVRSVVGRGSTATFWTSILASKDSDGDGASNGQELGDVDGDGVSTIPRSDVTNPGDSNSKPKKIDTDPPLITINGDSELTLEAGANYTELGAKATDNEDGDLSGSIIVTGEVNTKIPGVFKIFYGLKDSAGNEAVTITRTVFVVDTTSPVITLVGEAIVTVEVGNDYEDPGVAANDSVDGDLTSQIKVTGKVHVNKLGEYQLKYNVEDASGNAAKELVRNVIVVDSVSPIITLKGEPEITIEAGYVYSDQGATATDAGDGDLSEAIKITGEVDSYNPGSYEIRFDVEDSAGNEALTITRTVIVVDTTHPVITLTGEVMVKLVVGSNYEDEGATATDSLDGDLTPQIKVTGKVDVNKVGEYLIKYSVVDAAGNSSAELTRRIIVGDLIIDPIRIKIYNTNPFSFEFNSIKEKSYAIEFSTDLKEWKEINVIKGTGAIVRFEDERDQVFLQIYFRVRIID